MQDTPERERPNLDAEVAGLKMPGDKFIKIYDVFRKYVEHEDNLINHRTNWFVIIQSVLIATFGYSLQMYYQVMEKFFGNPNHKNYEYFFNNINSRYFLSLVFFCIIGVVTSIFALLSINAARLSLISIKEKWDLKHATKSDADELPIIVGGGNKNSHKFGFSLAIYLPISAIILWILLFLFVLFGFKFNFTPLP